MVQSSGQKKTPAKRKMHPNSLANLKPILWKPGESGNPKGSSLTQRLQDAMEKPPDKPTKESTVAELIINSTIVGALKREPTPFREVWDRTEGKVPDKVNIDLTAGLKELISEMRGLPELPEGEK